MRIQGRTSAGLTLGFLGLVVSHKITNGKSNGFNHWADPLPSCLHTMIHSELPFTLTQDFSIKVLLTWAGEMAQSVSFGCSVSMSIQGTTWRAGHGSTCLQSQNLGREAAPRSFLAPQPGWVESH